MKWTNFFKTIAILLTLTALSCAAGQEENEALPSNLTELRSLYESKKSELRTLNQEISKIEAALSELDTSAHLVSKTLVTCQPLAKQDFDHYIKIQGSVQADEVVNASSEMGGRIIDLKVKEGQNVSRGSLIAVIDAETLRKQKEEIETSLQLATTVFEKQSKLWEQEIGSEIQYLQAKNNKERLEKSLETIETQLKKANVYAPLTGVVDMVYAKEGELAGPGAPIVSILDLRRVKVVAEVPETYLGKVRKGDEVLINLPALNQEVAARVTLLGRTINAANRTFSVEAELTNSSGLLKPNLLAEIKFRDQIIKDAIVVPLYLVQQEVGGDQFVMVTDTTDKGLIARKMYVTTGISYNDRAVIEQGLQAGEQLIMEGAQDVSDGEPIEIVEQQAALTEKNGK
ncbi:MAG: efflux RND transporter periplasmic adaptor subunit [Saprospiraceae bacterium]|nr:efflux RND transporter periplasmic adaptor subunit [Saprospiraceae bacterium]